jgi:hypothetical protein
MPLPGDWFQPAIEERLGFLPNTQPPLHCTGVTNPSSGVCNNYETWRQRQEGTKQHDAKWRETMNVQLCKGNKESSLRNMMRDGAKQWMRSDSMDTRRVLLATWREMARNNECAVMQRKQGEFSSKLTFKHGGGQKPVRTMSFDDSATRRMSHYNHSVRLYATRNGTMGTPILSQFGIRECGGNARIHFIAQWGGCLTAVSTETIERQMIGWLACLLLLMEWELERKTPSKFTVGSNKAHFCTRRPAFHSYCDHIITNLLIFGPTL